MVILSSFFIYSSKREYHSGPLNYLWDEITVRVHLINSYKYPHSNLNFVRLIAEFHSLCPLPGQRQQQGLPKH
jgi:hypothetical protein